MIRDFVPTHIGIKAKGQCIRDHGGTDQVFLAREVFYFSLSDYLDYGNV